MNHICKLARLPFNCLLVRKSLNGYKNGLRQRSRSLQYRNNSHATLLSTFAPRPWRETGFLASTSYSCRFERRGFATPSSVKKSHDKAKESIMAERDLSNAMKSMNTNDVEDDSKKKSFESLNFDNLAITSLPYDDSTDPRVRRRVQRACFASAQLCPVENPETVIISQSALSLLDIDETEVDYEDQLFAEYFAGNKQFPGSQPSAHCYCGHQFGYFSGQLGDGAAMYLGEVINRNGERWELQLKGSGPTAFSRQADGRKVLRSSLREFLCSEAMYFLGIPTTRSASCVTSDTRVVRDMFYDGNPMMERATIISRIAPTFLRFGSFEIFKPKDPMTAESGPSFGHADILHQMLSYTIQTIFPEIHNKYSDNQLEKYSEFFKEVVLRTAKLVADWQCVGFCHGVLNTDNMSIAGLTIDYGPFGFMDYFNPDHICNSSDDRGRYTYQNQPSICKWNLLKLAEALQDALPLDQSHEIVKLYDAEFHKCFQKKMRKKLGLLKHELDEDIDLFTDLFETMRETRADFTNTFRYMSKIPVTKECDESDAKVLEYLQRQCQPLGDLKKSMKPNSTSQQIQLMLKLVQSSPEILAQLGDGAVRQLEMELEKLEKFKTIEKLTEQEKAENDRKLWRNWIEKYRKRLLEEFKGTEEQNDDAFSNRIKIMNENNPRIVLRNYVAQHAIENADEGRYEEARQLLKLLEKPYDDIAVNCKDESGSAVQESEPVIDGYQSEACAVRVKKCDYDATVPSWATSLRVS